MTEPKRYVEKPQPPFEALQLTWGNWDEMCDFVTVDGFRGVYLDEYYQPLPDNGTSDTLGAIVPLLIGVEEFLVAREGDYIACLGEDDYYVVSEHDFLADFEEVEAL